VPTSEYVEGLLFFLPAFGAVFLAAGLLVRRRLPQLVGVTRLLAFTLLATAGILAVHLLPAMVGLLSREAVLVVALLLLLAVAAAVPAVAGAPSGFPEPRAPSTPGAWLVAAIGCAAFAIWLVAAAWQRRYSAPLGIDTLSFHLPGVARWIQSGSIWEIDELLPDLTFGNYPNNGDMVLLSTVLPWKNDFLTHFVLYPFVALIAVAGYALGRELRAPAAPAALLGTTLAGTSIILEPPLVNSMPDPVMYASFGAGLLFLVRHRRTGATSDLVLAGLGLGIAFGTKWYGVTSVVVVIVVWLGARLLARTPRATVARQAAALCGLVAAAGGVWLVRNLVLSGNPLFPQKVSIFGHTIFAGPDKDVLRDAAGFRIADYLDQPRIWVDYLFHEYREAAGGPALLVVLLALAAVVVVVARRRRGTARPGDGAVAAMMAGAVVIAAVYIVTPYSALGVKNKPEVASANVRYAIPALIAAVGPAAWMAGRLRGRWLVALECLALAALFDGLRVSGVTTVRTIAISFGVATVAVAAAALLAYRGRTPTWPPPLGVRRAGIGAVVVLAAVVLVAGDRGQRTFNAGRYLGFDPVLDTVQTTAPSGHRIGLAGVWTDRGIAPIYPAFGPRLGNEVVYHGKFPDEMLRRYVNRRNFVRDLIRARYDLLIIGRGPTVEKVLAGETQLVQPRVKEEGWARAAGYREVLRSDRLILMRRTRG
jgi:hypothetical protein